MASEGAFAVTAEPSESEEALAWFRARFPVTEELIAVLGSYAGQRAWTIAAVADLDLVMTAHTVIGRGIEEGWDRKRLGRELRKVLTNFSEARCETIARTNVQKAYMAGRWEQLNDPDIIDAMPYRVYDAIIDGRTTDICNARDGTTLRHDDPWWLANWPPMHFNCFPAGTIVLTERGGVRIEDVSIGDRVLSHRGEMRSVVELHRNRERLIEVSTSLGSLVGTPSHPALTHRGWVELSALRAGDLLIKLSEPGVSDVSVEDSDRDVTAGAKCSHAIGAAPARVLRWLDDNAGIGQVEVSEHQLSVATDGMLEDEGSASCGEPVSELALVNRHGHGALSVPVRVSHEHGIARRCGSSADIGRGEPSAFDELGSSGRDTRVGLLGVAGSPVRQCCSRSVESRRLSRLPGVVSNPLESYRGASVASDTESLDDLESVLEANLELARYLSRCHLPADIEVSDEFVESFAVLLSQPEFDCALAVVSGHSDLDGEADVFNIGVDVDQSYVAGGFVVHNCRSNIRAATEIEAEMADASKRLPPLDADPPGATFGRPPPLDAPYAPNPSEYTAELFDAYQAKMRARD